MPAIKTLTIKGFKSIQSLEELKLGQLNLLIGGNGAGKSNFISFFKLLNEMVEGRLQMHVGQKGGPDALLRHGRRTTPSLDARLRFGNNGYSFRLVPTADNRLIFAEESLFFEGYLSGSSTRPLGSGHAESVAPKHLEGGPNQKIAQYVVPALKDWRVYHFHDTSDVAGVKRIGALNDNGFLRPDASNLAAFLFRLQQTHRSHYEKIRDTVRLVMPDFGDFLLRPSPLDPSGNSIWLEWHERGNDFPFLAHQLSDGTLRFICLATLLLQPELPSTILIDEPELGLHPFALNILASLLRGATSHPQGRQIIVATQSVPLIDLFAPEDVIVVDRSGGQSTFTRPSAESLKEWLDEYSLGQLWMKNVLGGRPSR